jgi:hypothetical protein
VAALEEAGAGPRPPGESADDLPAGAAATVAELIVEAGGAGGPAAGPRGWGKDAAGGPLLQAHFVARLANRRAGTEVFRRQWDAQLVRETEETARYHLALQGRFWQRWLKGKPGLVVELDWGPPEGGVADVAVRVRGWDQGKTDGALVRETAPLVLQGLRSQLEAYPERRARRRLPWPHPVQACFPRADGGWGEPVTGDGKDLSVTGVGLYLPCVPPGPQVRLTLTTPDRAEPVEVVGACVRVHRCPDGRYLVGMAFA